MTKDEADKQVARLNEWKTLKAQADTLTERLNSLQAVKQAIGDRPAEFVIGGSGMDYQNLPGISTTDFCDAVTLLITPVREQIVARLKVI